MTDLIRGPTLTEDWAKASSWDFWTSTGKITTLAELWDHIPPVERDEWLAHFVRLPAYIPAPPELKAEVERYLADAKFFTERELAFKYGTTPGAIAAWDVRGRGRRDKPRGIYVMRHIDPANIDFSMTYPDIDHDWTDEIKGQVIAGFEAVATAIPGAPQAMVEATEPEDIDNYWGMVKHDDPTTILVQSGFLSEWDTRDYVNRVSTGASGYNPDRSMLEFQGSDEYSAGDHRRLTIEEQMAESRKWTIVHEYGHVLMARLEKSDPDRHLQIMDLARREQSSDGPFISKYARRGGPAEYIAECLVDALRNGTDARTPSKNILGLFQGANYETKIEEQPKPGNLCLGLMPLPEDKGLEAKYGTSEGAYLAWETRRRNAEPDQWSRLVRYRAEPGSIGWTPEAQAGAQVGITKIMRAFPGGASIIHQVVMDASVKYGLAYVTWSKATANEIHVEPKFVDDQYLRGLVTKMTEPVPSGSDIKPWLVASSDPTDPDELRSLSLVHEAAHLLHYDLIRRGSDALGRIRVAMDEARARIAFRHESYPSQYARTAEPDEWLAEAITDAVRNGSKAQRASKEIANIFHEVYGGALVKAFGSRSSEPFHCGGLLDGLDEWLAEMLGGKALEAKYGTSAGAIAAWDTRGRGRRKPVESTAPTQSTAQTEVHLDPALKAVADEVRAGIAAVQEALPNTLNRLAEVKPMDDQTALATKSNTAIYVSKDFLNDTFMANRAKEFGDTSPENRARLITGTSRTSVIIHEYGHVLDGLLLHADRPIYDRLRAFMNEQTDYVDYKGDVTKMLRWQNGQRIPSMYAAESPYEYVAEAITDAIEAGPRAREDSKAVFGFFEKAFG